MLPVCSAAPTCSSLCPVTTAHAATRALRRAEVASFKSYAAASTDPLVRQVPDRPLLSDSSILSPFSLDPDDIVRGFAGESPAAGADNLCCAGGEPLLSTVSDKADPITVVAADRVLSDAPVPTSGIEDPVSRFVDDVSKRVFQAEDALTEAYDKLRLSAYDVLGGWRKAVDDAVGRVTASVDGALGGVTASVDATKNQAAGGVTGFSGALQDKVNGAGAVAVDVLRKTIVAAEDSLGRAATFVVYSYGSAKSSLPPNVRDLLNSSEEKAAQVLTPVGNALQQVYVVIEGVEKNVGLDPTDPIVQLVVLLGGSATIGISYWLFTYGGYSGDLSPELTLELLKSDEKAVLIDVRPEETREKDGVPDLRRGARSKYTSVTAPEIKGPIKKMIKGGRDVDDALLAVVIRNLKMIKGDSKVIILDANGAQSKAIARSLKKLGVKRPYLVKGGFQSWARNLRVKELKSETALTVINEDAEAILADIKATPQFVLGSVLGLSAVTYALLEWETTLQFIGVLGLSLTIFQRFSSYEGSEDLKQDISLLLSPVKVGAEAFSWAAKKLEPNKIGLPTSPSTTAVMDRVIQAAAKHESQPSDGEEQSAQTDGLGSEA